MLPVVAEDPAAPCALPTPDSWAWFTATGLERAPAWRNEVTLRSVELFTAYEPGAWLPLVSPTPLLMVVALGDHLTVADLARWPGSSGHSSPSGWFASRAGISMPMSTASRPLPPLRGIGSPSISWAAERCSSGLRRRRIRISGVAPRRYHGAGWPGGS